MTHKRLVENVLEARNKKMFIEHLTDVLEADSSSKEIFHNVVQQVVKMPATDVPLFITLLRFQYIYVSR